MIISRLQPNFEIVMTPRSGIIIMYDEKCLVQFCSFELYVSNNK